MAIAKSKARRTLTITLSLPATARVTEQEAKEVLALKWVEEGMLSQSEAAEVLGLSRCEVIDRMGQHHIPVMCYGPGDWEKESKVVDELQARRRGRSR
jgi:predicted HTH domain antitoxin